MLDYTADILTLGIERDGLNNLTGADLQNLWPVYYAQAMQGALNVSAALDEQGGNGQLNGLGSKIKKTVKKAISQVKTVIKEKPEALLTGGILAAGTAGAAGTLSVAGAAGVTSNPVYNVIQAATAAKYTAATTNYMVKNPQVALAIAAAVPGLNVVAILATAGAAVGGTELSKWQQEKLQEKATEYQEQAALMAQQGQPVPEAPVYWNGTAKELLDTIHKPEFLKAATENTMQSLLGMGYPNNAATKLLAEKSAKASIANMEEAAKNNTFQRVPGTPGNALKLLLPVGLAVAAFMS